MRDPVEGDLADTGWEERFSIGQRNDRMKKGMRDPQRKERREDIRNERQRGVRIRPDDGGMQEKKKGRFEEKAECQSLSSPHDNYVRIGRPLP